MGCLFQKLNAKQLDDFTAAMLNWQQSLEMEEWLKGNETPHD
ncbi:hypothetical protein [Scytonema hofmannii]|nr:hypothetical protein [Scytonema hofmannii]